VEQYADRGASAMVDARIRPATLTWWGHSSVELRMDGVRLVADPLLRRHVGPLASSGHRPRDLDVDLVLLSHLHRDHTDLPSVRRFGRRTTVVAPPGGRDLVGRRARGPVTELMVGESLRVGDVTVVAVPALHDGRRHVGGVEGQAVGYLVVGTQVVYLAGDTDMYDGMADLRRTAGRSVDVAVLPVSGWGLNLGPGHMDPRRAAESLRLLRPRLAVPVHWGTLHIPILWRLRPGHHLGAPHTFARLAQETSPGTTVVVPDAGRPVPMTLGAAVPPPEPRA
jgi:L-ascorbate metabolism protein UlaG (beta-lactamase superfamily)